MERCCQTGITDEERGQSTVEFAVILVLIAVVAILALIFLGDAIAELMALVGETVE